MTYCLGRSDYNLVLGALLIGQALLLPASLWLARRTGKRNALILGYAWWILCLAAMSALTPGSPRYAIYVLAFLMGGGVGAAAFLPWAIFPDVADVTEFVHGVRCEGAAGGFLTFARKCATALAAGAFAVALDLTGFVRPRAPAGSYLPRPQSPTVLGTIRGFLFLAPALLLAAGIAVAVRFKLTADLQRKVRNLLAFRRGESPAGDLPPEEAASLRRLFAEGKGGENRSALRYPIILVKAAVLGFLLPAGLLRLAGPLGRWVPAFAPGVFLRLSGLLLAGAGAYLALRAGLILACIGKEWPLRRPGLLVTKYVYSLVRHPFYAGYSLFLLGLALQSGAGAAVLLALLFAAAFMLYARFVEEPALVRRFGDRYRAYRARVGFLLPRRGASSREAFRLNLVLLFALVLGRFLFRFFWRVRVEGLENLPEEGPFLLAANHTNLADPFLIGIFLTRPVRFIASDELFRRPILRALFGLFFGALKKRRWSRDVGALRQAERWLGRGEAVGIFPEGGRTWDGGPVVVGDEVYRFLHHCRVPVVAAAVVGGHEALPRWASWPARARVTVRFYPPIEPGESMTVQQLRERIEERIFAGTKEPPVERTLWASHRGITTVAWACLRCGTAGAMRETAEGIVCLACGAAWRVTRRLELADASSGEILREWDYHRLIKERLAAGAIRGAAVIHARVKAFRINQAKLIPCGRGELSFDGQTLLFANDRHWLASPVEEIGFAFLNMPGHLVVTDRKGTMEYVLLDDSPVRWEDCLANARPERLSAQRGAEREAAGKG